MNGEKPAWMARGKCLGLTGTFFSEEGNKGENKAAKEICKGCPVIVECREYAISNCERFGVWAGLSAKQRLPLIARRRKADA